VTAQNLITSLVFAGFHLINSAPIHALLVIFPSLIFGYFQDRHGRVVAPITLHMFYNAGYIMLLQKAPQ
jgi:membrane protease YdiL (CAAX protease family)